VSRLYLKTMVCFKPNACVSITVPGVKPHVLSPHVHVRASNPTEDSCHAFATLHKYTSGCTLTQYFHRAHRKPIKPMKRDNINTACGTHGHPSDCAQSSRHVERCPIQVHTSAANKAIPVTCFLFSTFGGLFFLRAKVCAASLPLGLSTVLFKAEQ